MELLRELDQNTVEMRANYDGTTEEPVVLPARFPNLLVNGSTGIAVGMATNIPPHNLREITDALIALSKDRDIEHVTLMKHINGPDFPGPDKHWERFRADPFRYFLQCEDRVAKELFAIIERRSANARRVAPF